MTDFDTRFNEPDASPGFLLWQVSSRWQREIRDALAPFDLTHPQFTLLAGLAWLTREGAPTNQVQLAQFTQIDVMTTSQVVRSLETKGLLVRTAHPADARAYALSLTAQGHTLANQTVVIVEAADAAFFATLGPDQATLLQLLRRLRQPPELRR